MSGALHLARRFLGSLSPLPLGAADDEWARSHLLPTEASLWARMDRADRKHAVGVARTVADELGPAAERPVLAAALLHDVGKVDARLGTFGRVLATLVGNVADRDQVRHWQRQKGLTRRIGLYLRHDAVGGDLLELAGSDPLTVAWAREHHRPPDRWTVPEPVGAVLRGADDD